MPLLHNQLVRFWGNPTPKKYESYMASLGLLTDNDAQNQIKFGAYFIKKGLRLIHHNEPYRRELGLKYWGKNYEGNALLYTGIEFLVKGLFLKNGYAINEYKNANLNRDYDSPPIKILRNKNRLNPTRTRDLGYFLKHVGELADFKDFDSGQKLRNKIPAPGPRPTGLISTRYKHPTHNQIFEFIRLTRNSYLHTSKKMQTFAGIYIDMEVLLDYLCKESVNKSLNQLADLLEPIV